MPGHSRQLLAGLVGRGGGESFAEFLSSLPTSMIDGVQVGFAFDCNSPEELAAARARVSCP